MTMTKNGKLRMPLVGIIFGTVLLVGVFLGVFAAGPAWTPATASAKPARQDTEAQKVAWLKDHGIALRTTDIKDNDFSDLMPLVAKIGTARVVMLGEQSHGDGTVFLLKGRLIRFLHEFMGFDVLAWESGFYDCREMNAALASSMPLEDAIARGIFGIWGRSEQVYPLFEYARTTVARTNRLEMAGFDCQLSSPGAWNTLPDAMIEFIELTDPSALSREFKDKLRALPKDQNFMAVPAKERAARIAFYRTLPGVFARVEPSLNRYYGAREIGFWKKEFGNLQTFFEVYDILATATEAKRNPTAAEIKARDISMGENLTFLANEYYAGRKIIVWAASSHNLRDPQSIKVSMPEMKDGYKGYVTEGQTAYSHLGDDIYSIAFTAYQGKIGFANQKVPATDIGVSPPGSMADLMHKTGEKLLFVDFREFSKTPSHWLHRPIVDRPLGHSPMETDWTKQFDALIFTDVLEPSVRREVKQPEAKKPEAKKPEIRK